MRDVGASVFGVGSALVGMTSEQMGGYFKTVESDLADGGNQAELQVRYDVDMRYRPVTLVANERVADDIALLRFAEHIDVRPGEFFYLWIPGLGEKPFSALTDDPFALVVIDVGQFTHELMTLPAGTAAYIRGPHGIAVDPPADAHLIAVAGGTGLAAVYQVVRDCKGADLFVGARSADRLYFLEESQAITQVHVATDDGSLGYHGVVTACLDEHLASLDTATLARTIFYNCGPEPMVNAAEAVQRRYVAERQIFSAIDYLTKCGVGICGACSTPDGRRLCVDGPFLSSSALS